MKLLILICVVSVILLRVGAASADEKEDVVVEQTTVSPIEEMSSMDDTIKAEVMMTENPLKAKEETNNKNPVDAQQHTIADFIIHPLIALKPRVPATESSSKQSTAGTNTPSTWQLFGFNAGQGLGSSVSNLAGSVTGWLGNRIQLPGLVDTPVREPSTTSTTTTTARPSVIVRLKQRTSTKKPLIALNTNAERPYRKNRRPIRFNENVVDDSEENDDSQEYEVYESFNGKRGNRRRYQEYDEYDEDDDNDYTSNEYREDDVEEDGEEYEDEAEPEPERPVKQQPNRKRLNPVKYNQNQRKEIKHPLLQEESAEDDENEDQDYFYIQNPETKRSQNKLNFLKLGQQNLLKQIKQLTGGQTPSQIGNALHNSQTSVNYKDRKQATFLINRNGQTIYVAPELQQVMDIKRPTSRYPQPPLTVPYKRKGQPTQYITIPWSKLGIAPPNQVAAVAEDIQSQPLILKVPQSANKQQPSITAEAVPLLAEASIMDVSKPPRIPAAPASKASKKSAVTNNKLRPSRIIPGIVAAKVPAAANDSIEQKKNSTDEMAVDSKSTRFIVIADESFGNKLSRSAYQQILDHFNKNRVGRQINVDGAAATTVNETKEHLIPVQVIADEPESYKENLHELLKNTESHRAINTAKKETKDPVDDLESVLALT